MSRKPGRARVLVHVVPEPAQIGRWQHRDPSGQEWWNLTPGERREAARRGSRVGVTKPTIAARKAKRRAHRKRTGR